MNNNQITCHYCHKSNPSQLGGNLRQDKSFECTLCATARLMTNVKDKKQELMSKFHLGEIAETNEHLEQVNETFDNIFQEYSKSLN